MTVRDVNITESITRLSLSEFDHFLRTRYDIGVPRHQDSAVSIEL